MTRKFNQLGISVTEIVIVIALAGAIVIVLANLPATLGLIGQSNHQAVANQIIEKKIENLRSLGYVNLGNGSSTINDNRLLNLPYSTSEVLIEDCPETICTNGELVKKISIKVGWIESKGDKEVQVVTFISEGGLQ